MYLSRTDQFKHYNAMLFVKDIELLLSEAASLDKERECLLSSKENLSTLHGIPVIIKDNICTSDMPTTVGALALKGAESGFDAEIARRLRSAGAIIIGKANMHEFSGLADKNIPDGWSCLGGQVLNANSGSAHPGMSSSGSACAAALGLAAATIGTETTWSIISPSMHQSVVGFRPTRGLCSNSGIVPISTTFDTPGPICRSVEDVAAMLEVISKGNNNFCELGAFKIEGARAGTTLNHGSELNSKDSAHVVRHFTSFVFGKLRDLGCVVVYGDVVSDKLLSSDRTFYKHCSTIGEVGNPLLQDHYFVNSCEFKDGIGEILSKFAQIPSGVHDLKSLIEFNEQHPDALDPLTPTQKIMLECSGTGGLADPNYRPYLDRLLTFSEDIVSRIFSSDNLDFLITSVTGPEWPLIYELAMLSGYPTISIPLGKHPSSSSYSAYKNFTNHPGVGYSLILIGKPGDDHKLLCYAKQIEDILKTNQ
ncbi:hypothetical protein EV178_006532 [Coemansia sp. RSA 1646]|nr:hypothetical protein EV178_006532 [Coemansia sp. RSA 1646]